MVVCSDYYHNVQHAVEVTGEYENITNSVVLVLHTKDDTG